LHFSRFSWLEVALPFYRFSRMLKLDKPLKNLLLPENYKEEVHALDVAM
jgi:hypothetical protein